MLIAVSVMPHIFPMLERVPVGSHGLAGIITALATLLTVVVIIFKSNGIMRLWSPGDWHWCWLCGQCNVWGV